MVEPVGFVDAWKAQFPESDPPSMELNSMGEIEQELDKCKSSIKHFEKEVNKERFRMIYLQTLLAKEKKSYDGQSETKVINISDRTIEEDANLTWPRRSYSPGSFEEGYTPDCSSNENLTSSEEDFSSGQSSHVSPSPTTAYPMYHRDKSRSPSQQSFESSSPPTPLSQKRLKQQVLVVGSGAHKTAPAWPSDGESTASSRTSHDTSLQGDMEATFNDSSGSYAFDLDQTEDQTQDSFSGSPPPSPRFRSKSRSSRDTQSSGSLESALSDLLKHTPSSHPDLPLLQDALRISQNFLSSVNEEITPRRQSMTVKKGEGFTFLISSDYERAEWREIIREQQKKYLYCSLEVDSFGYFVNKAKTRVHRDSTEPNWNELDPQTLQNKDWQRTVIAMNGVQVLLYFLQLEGIPTPDSKRQSLLFSTEV
uniref:Bcr-Abl oncoprotein oligomerisation domain-containing protein n=1 Tax=Knipowitschia caucasica TaxID=637954 RepID=A0AAV2MSB8_KNICA